ncbi:hypothetical protein Taro_000077 [Colocasia esculenta]|uniref:Uncharacterized protein n=1 Tax=Colocasia esculenta TaxID=4460 RepID=A0A843TB58_COLES|nr:hypothetical protein [Colocasia esculenta]
MRGECPELKKKLKKEKFTFKKAKAMLATWSDEDKDEDAQATSVDEEIQCLIARSDDSNEEACFPSPSSLHKPTRVPGLLLSAGASIGMIVCRNSLSLHICTRDDEQRHEEMGEQQAPAPHGPTVLPPPPPMDYGVFMEGLVQAMQIQAQTQAALQAQLQAQAQAPAPVPQEHGHGGPSIMERFKRMAPPSFKGESQPLLAESWLREVEKIFQAIRCAEEDKVSLATYMLQVLGVYVLV